MDLCTCTQCGYSFNRDTDAKPTKNNTIPSMNALNTPQNIINITTVPHEVCANQKGMPFGEWMIMLTSTTLTTCDSQDMDERISDGLEPNHTPYENKAINDNVLVNNGIDT